MGRRWTAERVVVWALAGIFGVPCALVALVVGLWFVSLSVRDDPSRCPNGEEVDMGGWAEPDTCGPGGVMAGPTTRNVGEALLTPYLLVPTIAVVAVATAVGVIVVRGDEAKRSSGPLR